MSKANWTKFEALCLEMLTSFPFGSTVIDEFTSNILTIAEDCILKTSDKSIARKNLWFNDDCKEVMAERKRDLRNFKHEPISSNLDAFKISRA
ncbi:hypothetical protein BOW02_12425 [Solemya velum gill symbiont]|uniref:hypothetical protein n=1 Tax=Solemya velum gill symbiont TaxID=2340 RepID=UPI0009989850|nr:hypothetical protein [Solemya velum gill symbiont]OOY58438.1 hypothetical protein BOW02_12425 [Solemya velum gill symbiont]